MGDKTWQEQAGLHGNRRRKKQETRVITRVSRLTETGWTTGAGRGIRTLTGSPPPHFECGASAISPPRPVGQRNVTASEPTSFLWRTRTPCYSSRPIYSSGATPRTSQETAPHGRRCRRPKCNLMTCSSAGNCIPPLAARRSRRSARRRISRSGAWRRQASRTSIARSPRRGKAFDEGPWPRLTPLERSRILHRVATILRERIAGDRAHRDA